MTQPQEQTSEPLDLLMADLPVTDSPGTNVFGFRGQELKDSDSSSHDTDSDTEVKVVKKRQVFVSYRDALVGRSNN